MPAFFLIVDDTPRKVSQNYGNAIYVREWPGDPGDDELRALGGYLASIREEADFRRLEKRGWRHLFEGDP